MQCCCGIKAISIGFVFNATWKTQMKPDSININTDVEINNESFIFVPTGFLPFKMDLKSCSNAINDKDLLMYESIMDLRDIISEEVIPLEAVKQVYASKLNISDWASKSRNFYNNRIRNLESIGFLRRKKPLVNGISLGAKISCLELTNIDFQTILKINEDNTKKAKASNLARLRGSKEGTKILKENVKLADPDLLEHAISNHDMFYINFFAPSHIRSKQYSRLSNCTINGKKTPVHFETTREALSVPGQREFKTLLALMTLSYIWFENSSKNIDQGFIENKVPIKVKTVAKMLSTTVKRVKEDLSTLILTQYFLTGSEMTSLGGIQIGDHIPKRFRFLKDIRPLVLDNDTKELTYSQMFDLSSIVIIEWDRHMFDSLVTDEKLFLFPLPLLEASTELFQLYIALRLSRWSHTNKEMIVLSWDEFSRNVDLPEDQSIKEYTKGIIRYKSNQSLEGTVIQNANDDVLLVVFWGYSLKFDVAEKLVTFSVNKEDLALSCRTTEAPIMFNNVARKVEQHISSMPPSFARQISAHININYRTSKYLTTITVGGESIKICKYTSDCMLQSYATFMADSLEEKINLPVTAYMMYLCTLRTKKETLKHNGEDFDIERFKTFFEDFSNASSKPSSIYISEINLPILISYLVERPRILQMIYRAIHCFGDVDLEMLDSNLSDYYNLVFQSIDLQDDLPVLECHR